MTPEVKECFKRVIENRKKPKVEPIIQGYSKFLFLDKNKVSLKISWPYNNVNVVFGLCIKEFYISEK